MQHAKQDERTIFIDAWAQRPVETFSNTLTEDVLDPATIRFAIQLPNGMFHAPAPEPTARHVYGVWTDVGIQDENAPGADVRLAPYGPKTLDELAKSAPLGDEVVAKQTLPDGAIAITTRRPHAWYVNQLHVDRAGHAVQCTAWRRDDRHDLGEPTRHMLEKICGSLVLEPGGS